MKIPYFKITALLVLLTVVSFGLSAVTGPSRQDADEDTVSVTASFYPIYTAVMRVAGGSEGVSVACLTQPTGGCLHEYQLSPTERLTLENTDVLFLNGAGAEAFLEPSLKTLPQVRVVDTSAGLTAETHTAHEHDEHAHAQNEHIWMSPTEYARQVNRICEVLCEVDTANADIYRRNAEQYKVEIEAVAADTRAAVNALPTKQVALFHDSLAYWAAAVGLEPVGTLSIGEDSGFSAAEVAALADAVTGQEVLFLYDAQYPLQMTQLTAYADKSAIATLLSAVQPTAGVAVEDAWLYAMKENAARLRAAAEEMTP